MNPVPLKSHRDLRRGSISRYSRPTRDEGVHWPSCGSWHCYRRYRQGPETRRTLNERPKELKRGADELFDELHRYLDKTIATTDKRSRCAEELYLLEKMEKITLEVIGRTAENTARRCEFTHPRH